jgi:hypothetical protein
MKHNRLQKGSQYRDSEPITEFFESAGGDSVFGWAGGQSFQSQFAKAQKKRQQQFSADVFGVPIPASRARNVRRTY